MKRPFTDLKQTETESSVLTLQSHNKPIASLNALFGGDYNDYDDYGNSFNESGYDLPGIIVTPDGSYPEDDSWNSGNEPWNDNNQDDEWGFDDFTGSGGSSSGSAFDKDYSNGMAVLYAMNDSIKNGTALVVEKFTDSICLLFR